MRIHDELTVEQTPTPINRKTSNNPTEILENYIETVTKEEDVNYKSLLAPSDNKRAIRQIDPTTNEILMIWPSMSEAKKKIGSIRKSVLDWDTMRTRTICCGYYWEFNYQPLMYETKDIRVLEIVEDDIIKSEICIELKDSQINHIDPKLIILTSDGEIFDSRQQKWKYGYKHNSGYYVISKNILISNKRKKKSFKMHQLLAFAFDAKGFPTGMKFKEISKKYEVDHINNNKLDNTIKNLQYLTIKEHRKKSKESSGRKPISPIGRRMLQIDPVTKNVIKIWESVTEVANYYNDIIQNFTPKNTNGQRKKNGFIWKYEIQQLLDNEIFKKLELFNEYYIEVSNKGRVKKRKSGKIWLGTKRPDNYYCVRYNNKGFKVHRLVAETFLKEELDKLIKNSRISKDKLEVDHIDGNNSNNCVENLRWTTRNEHMKKTGKQIKLIKSDVTY